MSSEEGLLRRRSSHQLMNDEDHDNRRGGLLKRIQKSSSRKLKTILARQPSSDGRSSLDSTRHSKELGIPDEATAMMQSSKSLPVRDYLNSAHHGGDDVLKGWDPFSNDDTCETASPLDEDEEASESPQVLQVEWKLAPNGRYEAIVRADTDDSGALRRSSSLENLGSLQGSWEGDESLGTAGTSESLRHDGDVRTGEHPPSSDKSLVGRLSRDVGNAATLASRDFYLPQLIAPGEDSDDERSLPDDDPLALENILRPWQVEFLETMNIKTADELLLARENNQLTELSMAMRRWRRKKKLPSFRTKSCFWALRVWARSCRSIVRSVREQREQGAKILMKPDTMVDKTQLARSHSTGTRTTEASTDISNRSGTLFFTTTVGAASQKAQTDAPIGAQSVIANRADQEERIVRVRSIDEDTAVDVASYQKPTEPSKVLEDPPMTRSESPVSTDDIDLEKKKQARPKIVRSASSPSLKRGRGLLGSSSSSLSDSGKSRTHHRRRSDNTHADLLAIHRARSTPIFHVPLKSCLKSRSSDELSKSSSAVCFSEVQFREYERILSDNPSVTDGPPIGIGWKYDPKEIKFPVDEYESARPPRRVKEEFLMPAKVRRTMLLDEYDYPYAQLRRTVSETDSVKAHRRRLARRPRALEKADELMESSKRHLRRLRSGLSKVDEQERLWEEAQEYFAHEGRRSSV